MKRRIGNNKGKTAANERPRVSKPGVPPRRGLWLGGIRLLQIGRPTELLHRTYRYGGVTITPLQLREQTRSGPSPRAQRRRRIVRRAFANPERLDSSQRGMRRSLFLRERARVRGNEMFIGAILNEHGMLVRAPLQASPEFGARMWTKSKSPRPLREKSLGAVQRVVAL